MSGQNRSGSRNGRRTLKSEPPRQPTEMDKHIEQIRQKIAKDLGLGPPVVNPPSGFFPVTAPPQTNPLIRQMVQGQNQAMDRNKVKKKQQRRLERMSEMMGTPQKKKGSEDAL